MEQLTDQINVKLNHTNWVLAGCRRPFGQLTYDFYYLCVCTQRGQRGVRTSES